MISAQIFLKLKEYFADTENAQMCHKTEEDLKHLTTDLFALSLRCVFYKELFFIKSFIMYRDVCELGVSVDLLSFMCVSLAYIFMLFF